MFSFLASYLYFFYISIASSSFVPSVLDMAGLRANGIGVSIFFPIHANVFANVFFLHLSIRFLFQDGSIWVERKIYDPLT